MVVYILSLDKAFGAKIGECFANNYEINCKVHSGLDLIMSLALPWATNKFGMTDIYVIDCKIPIGLNPIMSPISSWAINANK